MELVLIEDPIEKLERLMKEAKALPGNKVSHIAVSRKEMKDLVTHIRAPEVLSDFINPQKARAQRAKELITALRNNQNNPATAIPQQEFFDALDPHEKTLLDIKNYIPKEINQNGIIIRASIK